MKFNYVLCKALICLLLTGAASLIPVKSAHALLTCKPNDYRKDTIPLIPGVIAAGDELPLGTVIFRGTWADTRTAFITCTSDLETDSGHVDLNLGIESASLPLSNWSGSPYPGKVYQTNIPGIGIAIWNSGNAVTESSSNITSSNLTINIIKGSPTGSIGVNTSFDIELIKIGSTPPGSYTVSSASFPTAKVFYTARDNATGLPFTMRSVSFSGAINVTASTCSTPDVNVDLGKFAMDTTFPKVGSASPWVKFPIQLTNCPVFSGYFTNSNAVQLQTRTGGSSVPTPTNNQIGMKITPQTPVVNASQGTFQVTESARSAQGVAIQLATANVSTPQTMNLSTEYKYAMSPVNGSSVTIPMAARYLRTDANIKPGQANGKVTFTINYY